MSIRAYRINKIDSKEKATFNLSHDEDLMKILDRKGLRDNLNENGGIIEVPVDILEWASSIKALDENVKKAIKKDIEWAKKKGEEYIQYYCF